MTGILTVSIDPSRCMRPPNNEPTNVHRSPAIPVTGTRVSSNAAGYWLVGVQQRLACSQKNHEPELKDLNGDSNILAKLNSFKTINTHIWLVVSTHLKNISQIGNLPQIGVKIKKI